MKETEYKRGFQLLFDVYTGLYTSRNSECRVPCDEVEYQVFHRSTDTREGGYTMFLVFDQVVDVSRSHLVVDGLTFVNRLGGTIGFCKELLWTILMFGSFISFTKKFLHMFR